MEGGRSSSRRFLSFLEGLESLRRVMMGERSVYKKGMGLELGGLSNLGWTLLRVPFLSQLRHEARRWRYRGVHWSLRFRGVHWSWGSGSQYWSLAGAPDGIVEVLRRVTGDSEVVLLGGVNGPRYWSPVGGGVLELLELLVCCYYWRLLRSDQRS